MPYHIRDDESLESTINASNDLNAAVVVAIAIIVLLCFGGVVAACGIFWQLGWLANGPGL